MSKRNYKAAIVGLGNVAWKYRCNRSSPDCALTHADVYQKRPDVELAGGCSPQKEDQEGFNKRYKVPVFDSIDELLTRISPDIVSICSPHEFHFEHTLKCFEYRVPMIWLEKPASTKTSEISTLIEEQKKHRSTVLVNYQRRYNECYKRLKDLYINNSIGKVEFISLIYSKGLLQNGSHMLDILLYVLGDDVNLSVENVTSSSTENNFSFILRALNSLQIFVAGISVPYHCADIVLICKNGRASVLYGGMETKVETRFEHELFKGFYRLKEQDNKILGDGDITQAMSNALEDLILSYRQKTMPQSNLVTASKTLEIISKVR